ncbi:Protein ABIL2 [Glycine soja]|nr:Protein ABIL2 [Glycine max]
MGKITTFVAQPVSQEASNYDEVFLQLSLLFDDILKLNILNSHTPTMTKNKVVETLKDYAIKALVNRVDHLGYVTYKVNDLLEEEVVKVFVVELRVLSLVIGTPKYHKRYILLSKYPEFSSTLSSYGVAFFFHFYYI